MEGDVEEMEWEMKEVTAVTKSTHKGSSPSTVLVASPFQLQPSLARNRYSCKLRREVTFSENLNTAPELSNCENTRWPSLDQHEFWVAGEELLGTL